MHPEGSKLPALERNILKLRTFEMALFLFYAEDFKRSILDAIQTTDKFYKLNRGDSYIERIPPGAKRPLEKALGIMVSDGVFTSKERDEIIQLIDYRNRIAHRIDSLTEDLGAPRLVGSYFSRATEAKYDYGALRRLRALKSKFDGGYFDYIRTIEMEFGFGPVEKALSAEIKSLRKKIDRQYRERQKKNHDLQEELTVRADEKEASRDFYHPANQYGEGRLTLRGIEVCYRLFDGGRTPLAVACIMRLSLRATRRRYRLWLELGGKHRKRSAALPGA